MRLIIIVMLVLGFPDFLSAELYKYYDRNGIICFTDDFSIVPEDQRSGAEAIREIQTKEFVVENRAADGAGALEINDRKAALKEALEQESRQIRVVEKELNDEFVALKERRDRLILEGKRKMTPDETRAYNLEAGELNQNTLKYKERKQAYLRRVEQYNLKLESAP